MTVAIRWHEEDPTLFREAIRFTAAETGFSPRLIEKDYFCSVVLEHLAAGDKELIFKGGTCLAKVHAAFYRLSEDLDFSISTPINSTRASRSRSVATAKALVAAIAKQHSAFRIAGELTGSNASTQYNALLGYTSLLDVRSETISVEIGLREPIIDEAHLGAAKTMLLNPIRSDALIAAFQVRCLSYAEAMAEKLRAALCRREVAIRDFFDVDYAVRNAGFDALDPAIGDLLRRKLDVPGTEPVDVSLDRLTRLRRQLDAQLQPVLRAQDFGQFDLDRAFETIRGVARHLQ